MRQWPQTLLQAFGQDAKDAAKPTAGAKKGGKASLASEADDDVQLTFFGKVKAFLGALSIYSEYAIRQRHASWNCHG